MNRRNLLGIVSVGTAIAVVATGCSSTKSNSNSGGGSVVLSQQPSASATATVPLPDKAKKDYKITFIQGVEGDPFYITMQCGIQAEAQKLGVTVNTQGPQKFDPTLQKPIFDSAVNAKPDAILIAPTDVKAMQAPLAAAAAAGTKIVLVDTTTQDPSYAVSAIASDNVGGGKAAFDAIKQLAPQGGKVLAISVDPGVSTTDARVKGFSDAAAADSKYKYVGVQYSHNDPATAAQLVTAALQKDPDIVGVFAANIFSAQGSATGIQQAGKKGKVNVVGFDAGPDQVKALQSGTVQAIVAQQPAYIGTVGLGEAVAALDGGTVTKAVQTGFSIVTAANMNGDQKDALYKASC
jgi:ribose transport system substrate-binding protein